MYLVAVMDWSGAPWARYVLAWQLSNTMDVHFCIDALEMAITYGKPQIFNSDQGAQFTSDAFTSLLIDAEIDISMDGKGRFVDNIFIERLWRSLKYELIYLKAFEDGSHLNQEVKKWFDWYNQHRLHQSLKYTTPDEVYFQAD